MHSVARLTMIGAGRTHRLKWADLAARNGQPVVPAGRYPSFRTFPGDHRDYPDKRWFGADEGVLDLVSWHALLAVIADAWGQGWNGEVLGLHTRAQFGWDGEYALSRGSLSEFLDPPLIAGLKTPPANLWAPDLAWMVYTDWDLQGTRVGGSEDLINQLLRSSDLEVVVLGGPLHA